MVAFTAGSVLTAANLNTAFNTLTFRAVTGTSDTLVLADAGGAVSFSNASPITATVPPFSSVAYANGTVIQLLNLGAGVVTITAGVGVTLNGSIVTLAQNAGGTLIKTATNTWYFLPSASGGSGMDLITPTSVVNATLSGGAISFAAQTTASINGCFTTAYDVYRLLFRGSTSAAAGISARLRASGSDASGANYNAQIVYGAGVTTGATQNISDTGWAAIYDSGAAEAACNFSMDLFRPALAEPTTYATIQNYGAYVALAGGGRHTLSTAYDGLTLFRASGTFTGTLRIYGLRNS